MNSEQMTVFPWIMAVVFLMFGCAGPAGTNPGPVADLTGKSETATQFRGAPPKTLAILPFENNSVTDAETYAPLTKGLASLLSTELLKSQDRIELIERNRIQSLVGEIASGQGGIIDQATAVKAGKMLGAESIAFGSFIVLGNTVRIDTRIAEVETGRLVMGESVTGKSENFLELVTSLSQKIANALNVTLSRKQPSGESDINAALLFSKGLDALDTGKRSAAEDLFMKSVERDPGYQARVREALQAETAKSKDNAVPENTEHKTDTSEKVVIAEAASMLSRADAVRQAQRVAVEQALGVVVDSLSEIEDLELKKEKIFTHSQGYVTRFTVLEERTQGDIHFVKISATVSLDKIQNDLVAMKILLDNMERPKIMVLVDEEYMGIESPDRHIAATEIGSMLMAKGFELVDKIQTDNLNAMEQEKQALAGNAEAAKHLGYSLGAQYVVLGKAVVSQNDIFQDSAMKSVQSDLEVKVIQTRTGLILGSVVKSGVAAHINPLTGASLAIRSAAQQAVDDYLADAITDSFQDFLNNGAPLKLVVTGVDSFRRFKALTESMNDIDKVVSSKKESWNKAGGLLVLDLRFKGTSEELAIILDEMDFAGDKLEIMELEPERLQCRVK